MSTCSPGNERIGGGFGRIKQSGLQQEISKTYVEDSIMLRTALPDRLVDAGALADDGNSQHGILCPAVSKTKLIAGWGAGMDGIVLVFICFD